MSPNPGSRLVLTLAVLMVPVSGVRAEPSVPPVAVPSQPRQQEQAAQPINDPDVPGSEPGGGAAQGPDGGESGGAAGSEPAARQRFLLVSADRQSFDSQLGKLVAEGQVEARFDGWLLLADRVEVLEATRTVYARGRIRLIRGAQKLQAGRLRYSELEGTGELEDVYGVIDQELLNRELKALNRPADPDEPASTGSAAGTDQEFACPELLSDPRQSSVQELIPPRRVALPTLPPPAGCPGAEATTRPRPLRERLTDVALGPSEPDSSSEAEDVAGPAVSEEAQLIGVHRTGERIRQRVQDVRLRQSLGTGISFDVGALGDDEGDRSSGDRGGYRPFEERGRLNRLRFQTSILRINGNRWTAQEIAFTNDPFTPARSWVIGYGVEAQLQENGVTRIQAQRTRVLLSNRLSLPGTNNATVGGEEGQQIAIAIRSDRDDRDGVYLGYNLSPVRLGEKGLLDLQPQFMLQRAIEGRTSSYTAPGGSLGGPTIDQDIRVGDLFGLSAVLDLPFNRFRLQANADLSTLNPENFVAGTRSTAFLSTALNLPRHDAAQVGVFGSYRERRFNGSLDEQTIIYSYGAELSGSLLLNRPGSDSSLPRLSPFRLDWNAIGGTYRAELFESNTLDTQWRARLRANLGSSIQLWEAPPDTKADEVLALRYSPVPITPRLAVNFGLVGTGTIYQEGDQQNTLAVYVAPTLTLGRLQKPWFDYTEIGLRYEGGVRDGLSPFSFDRAVDLNTISFRIAQQLYGPLVLEGGATVNIDDSSGFRGDLSNSYVELKLLQRSYELGIFYSPYEGTAGIRVRLNDFSFSGSGTPFVPRPSTTGEPPLSENR